MVRDRKQPEDAVHTADAWSLLRPAASESSRTLLTRLHSYTATGTGGVTHTEMREPTTLIQAFCSPRYVCVLVTLW